MNSMNGKVLIVDDSLTVRMDLAEAFEAAGVRPLLCSSIREARDAFAAQVIDLVILDVLLPDGDGVALLKEIRAAPATCTVPVLLLSSEADVRDRIRGLWTGANDYVGKPYDAGYVVARARELLRRRMNEGPIPAAADKITVLVIDDDATFLEALRCALEQLGYGVMTATTGEEGLQLAATGRPAALIIDGVTPRSDRVTLIRKLREGAGLRSLPCLLLIASKQQGAELRALDAGADAFVRKEEDMDVILARFTAMLRTVRTERGVTSSLASTKRILAVDDSLTYLHELEFALCDAGYDVILAHSGEEAMAMLTQQKVDCILLDLLMPGIGGQESCRRIKASPTLRNTPLIMLTAVEDRQALLEGLGAGADDYIAKSSEFDVLRARIQVQIRRQQFEDENRRNREQLLRSELQVAETRAARELAGAKAALIEELKYKNKELEAFSNSMSQHLRVSLRSIDGISQTLLDDCAARLDGTAQSFLSRIRATAQRMSALIDDMLLLSRLGRAQIKSERVDLSALVHLAAGELKRQNPDRDVELHIQPEIFVQGDRSLMRLLLDNLLGNAWKFTARTSAARIEFRAQSRESDTVFLVQDNGAGFDMARASALFQPFQRLHTEAQFPGTGIGLATVQRIVDLHGGRVWAEGAVDRGATVFFTVSSFSR